MKFVGWDKYCIAGVLVSPFFLDYLIVDVVGHENDSAQFVQESIEIRGSHANASIVAIIDTLGRISTTKIGNDIISLLSI